MYRHGSDGRDLRCRGKTLPLGHWVRYMMASSNKIRYSTGVEKVAGGV